MNQKSQNSIKTSEKELVQRAQDGDYQAFTELIEGYRSKIYGLALKLSKNREDAEDIFQETFLKAIDNIKQFRAESSFGTWLFTIAVNNVRAKYAKESKADLLSVEEYLPSPQGHTDDNLPQLFDWKDPLSKLTGQELQRKLEEAIKELPLTYRIPFILRYIEEMPVQEVADTLKISLAAAKSRILRARLALRKSLNDYFVEVKADGPL